MIEGHKASLRAGTGVASSCRDRHQGY